MMMDSIASSAEMLFDPFDDDETFPPTGPRGVTPRQFIRWRGTLSYVPTPRRAPGLAGCLPELMAPRLMADATDMTWFALWRLCGVWCQTTLCVFFFLFSVTSFFCWGFFRAGGFCKTRHPLMIEVGARSRGSGAKVDVEASRVLIMT